MNTNTLNNDKGFTLIETLATLSIMSVLATISVASILPAWQAANEKIDELKVTTSELATLQSQLDTLNTTATTTN